MPLREYATPIPGTSKYREIYSNRWTNSSKVNGKLVLTSHDHSLVHSRASVWTNVNPNASTCQGAEAFPRFVFTDANYNEVYSKFVGKLRQGSGSLGVTLASWGQSRSMIVERLGKLTEFFQAVRKKRLGKKPKSRVKPTSLGSADVFLEGEFGWLPLLQDIHALCETIAGDHSIPRQWTKASSRFTRAETVISGSNPKITSTFTGKGLMTISASVDISNPNLWLANRMGVINPAVVAWDLVPWSFVVNMFVNVNQILGSFTDTVGLNLGNCSTTTSYSVLMEQVAYTKLSDNEAYYNHSNVLGKGRNRVSGNLPRPSLQFKLPKVNFELMAIASALTRQQVERIR